MCRYGRVQVQEAALSALAALARDNFDVASVLSKPPERSGAAAESPSGLSLALALCKSRNTDVQLAAALCATHIIRASVSSHHPSSPDLPAAMTVMHVMNRLISSSTDSPHARTKSCFILKYLVTDEKELCQMAFDGGSLSKLADLVKSITPTDKASEWDEDEAESICCLREAALTTIAVLALANDDIRRDITDNMKLVPTISTSLAHRHAGIRYAACHLVDSGLGTTLFQRLLKEDEDRRVTYAALTAICNLINEYSPLRQPFLDQGLVKRLLQLLGSEYSELRLNALWAVKNLVYKCSAGTKRSVLREIGWKEIGRLLSDPDVGVQEQAIFIIRNFADCEDDVDIVFDELGSERLLDLLCSAMESKSGDVVLQAAYALSNLANGRRQHQEQILAHGQILRTLRSCLVDAPMDVRHAAVTCVLQLAEVNDWKQQELRDAGLDSTLRHICEYGGGPISPGAASATAIGVERDVKDKARRALDLIEHQSHSLRLL
ncbi:hypothetical protein EWM64_g8156 [Hericium alpestre]|uniref:Uncharacterized protein n=1 Tax=Hericium alpestre TaxID=135208 RepID=A0A4Y9ZNM3_9AGAM|nr:hypothetical protein EWM64_g8156 [Hericium alpestre]